MVIFLCIPCLLLLLYFIVLGMFVPKYKGYWREALKCFVDKLKGRKCSISFDERMRISFSGWLADKGHIKAARFFNNKKNFEITMIVAFVVVTIVSTYLFALLIHWLFVQSPCIDNACKVLV